MEKENPDPHRYGFDWGWEIGMGYRRKKALDSVVNEYARTKWFSKKVTPKERKEIEKGYYEGLNRAREEHSWREHISASRARTSQAQVNTSAAGLLSQIPDVCPMCGKREVFDVEGLDFCSSCQTYVSSNPEQAASGWRLAMDVTTASPEKHASMSRTVDRLITGARKVPRTWDVSRIQIQAKRNPESTGTARITVEGISPPMEVRAFDSWRGFCVFHTSLDYEKPYVFEETFRDQFGVGDRIEFSYFQGPRTNWRKVFPGFELQVLSENMVTTEITRIRGYGDVRAYEDFQGFSVFYNDEELPMLFDVAHRTTVTQAKARNQGLTVTHRLPRSARRWIVVRPQDSVVVEGSPAPAAPAPAAPAPTYIQVEGEVEGIGPRLGDVPQGHGTMTLVGSDTLFVVPEALLESIRSGMRVRLTSSAVGSFRAIVQSLEPLRLRSWGTFEGTAASMRNEDWARIGGLASIPQGYLALRLEEHLRIFHTTSAVSDLINEGDNLTIWVDPGGLVLSLRNHTLKMSTGMRIPVVRFTIGPGEGIPPGCTEVVEAGRTFTEASQRLAQWAEENEAPAHGYLKTKFTVYYADDMVYEGECDLKAVHITHGYDLGRHMIEFNKFYGGLATPDDLPQGMNLSQYHQENDLRDSEEVETNATYYSNYQMGDNPGLAGEDPPFLPLPPPPPRIEMPAHYYPDTNEVKWGIFERGVWTPKYRMWYEPHGDTGVWRAAGVERAVGYASGSSSSPREIWDNLQSRAAEVGHILEVPDLSRIRQMAETATPERSLRSALEDLRRREATARGINQSRIFSDAVLERLVLARPTTLTALRHLSGVGAITISNYGQAILNTIREVMERGEPTPSEPSEPSRPAVIPAGFPTREMWELQDELDRLESEELTLAEAGQTRLLREFRDRHGTRQQQVMDRLEVLRVQRGLPLDWTVRFERAGTEHYEPPSPDAPVSHYEILTFEPPSPEVPVSLYEILPTGTEGVEVIARDRSVWMAPYDAPPFVTYERFCNYDFGCVEGMKSFGYTDEDTREPYVLKRGPRGGIRWVNPITPSRYVNIPPGESSQQNWIRWIDQPEPIQRWLIQEIERRHTRPSSGVRVRDNWPQDWSWSYPSRIMGGKKKVFERSGVEITVIRTTGREWTVRLPMVADNQFESYSAAYDYAVEMMEEINRARGPAPALTRLVLVYRAESRKVQWVHMLESGYPVYFVLEYDGHQWIGSSTPNATRACIHRGDDVAVVLWALRDCANSGGYDLEAVNLDRLREMEEEVEEVEEVEVPTIGFTGLPFPTQQERDVLYIPSYIQQEDQAVLTLLGSEHLAVVKIKDRQFYEQLIEVLDGQAGPWIQREFIAFRTTADLWDLLRQPGELFHRNKIATTIYNRLEKEGTQVPTTVVVVLVIS